MKIPLWAERFRTKSPEVRVISRGFQLERWRQFVEDCQLRGIGLPSLHVEHQELEHAQHCAARGSFPVRSWAGSMTAPEVQAHGAVVWFQLGSDIGALRVIGLGNDDQKIDWRERALLAEALAAELEQRQAFARSVCMKVLEVFENPQALSPSDVAVLNGWVTALRAAWALPEGGPE